jgi:hypothetical protein
MEGALRKTPFDVINYSMYSIFRSMGFAEPIDDVVGISYAMQRTSTYKRLLMNKLGEAKSRFSNARLGRVLLITCITAFTASAAYAEGKEEQRVPCSVKVGSSTFNIDYCTVVDTGSLLEFWWSSGTTQLYRAEFSIDDGQAIGRWNGFGAKNDIDQSLGTLVQEENCWLGNAPQVHICLFTSERAIADWENATSQEWPWKDESSSGNEVGSGFAQSGAVTAPRDRSSFRGLFLGMPVGSIAASVDGDFSLTAQNTAGNELSQFFETVRGLEAAQSLFIQQSGRNCGQVLHDGDVVTQLTLYQCFFNLTGNITAEEFARQVLERYPMRDGMQGRQQMLGDGAYRFLYTEYTGHTANERLVVSHHQMFDRVELAVSPVSQARF